MLFASSYPFLDIMWTMFIFFAWVIWIWLLIMILADNFRRTDISGWAKAGWTLFVIFLPLLGVLVYMIPGPGNAAVAASRPPATRKRRAPPPAVADRDAHDGERT